MRLSAGEVACIVAIGIAVVELPPGQRGDARPAPAPASGARAEVALASDGRVPARLPFGRGRALPAPAAAGGGPDR